MLSVSNLLCGHRAGNEALRYGHAKACPDGAPRPVVVWAMTRACNLRCVHCYASATAAASPNELSAKEGQSLLEDLAAFRIPALLLSGGEPLLRPDFFPLLARAKALGLRCTLSTNGVLLDEAAAGRLSAAGLTYAGVSLDGTEAVHDRLRGKAGAFESSLGALRRCRSHGIRTGVRFTIHRENRNDLDAMFDLCLAERIDRLCVYHLAWAGRGKALASVDLSPNETRAAMDRIFDRTIAAHKAGSPLEVLTVGNHADAGYLLRRLEREAPDRAKEAWKLLSGTGGNRSGQNIAAIDPEGGVHVDQFSWHYAVGNIRQSPFSRIWTDASDPRLAILRDRTSRLPEKCRRCRVLLVCNGNLRARAEAATGNFLGMDPGCYLSEEETAGPPPA